MPLDCYFLGSTKPLRHARVSMWQGRNVAGFMNSERCEVVRWISDMASWDAAFDFTFGQVKWKGRRHGRRKDQRDGLLVAQRYSRGRDVDDALDLCRKFMHRVLPEKSWVCAIEPNRNQLLNPGCHGHLMFESGGDVYFKAVHDEWMRENGWAKCNPIRNRGACETYCTKHLVGRGKIFGFEIYAGDLLSRELVAAL